MTKKWLFIILLAGGLVVLGAAFLVVSPLSRYQSKARYGTSSTADTEIFEVEHRQGRESEKQNREKAVREEARVLLVGDVMLSRSVGAEMRQRENWRWPFLKVASFTKEADVLFGNLEGPISDKGHNVGSKYSFRADPRVVQGLKYAGFDVLSVANNHIGDWARAAMEDTFSLLQQNGIKIAGGGFSKTKAHLPAVVEVNGTKIGFLAYTGLGPAWTKAESEASGIAFINKQRVENDIRAAQKLADIIIVSFHFGNEYHQKPNEYQTRIARSSIDAGADLVAGHHPHVVQPVKEYKNGYIAYSLGNFLFDQTFSKETMRGLVLEAVIKDGQIIEIKKHPTRITPNFQIEMAF